MTSWLVHAGLAVIVLGLLSGGLGAPIPEDPFLIAAGILASGETPGYALLTLCVCLGAVLLGDMILYFGARRLGPKILERPVIKRVLPPQRLAQLDALFEHHGGRLIFIARHIPGFRSAVFILAGVRRLPFATFMAWDTCGALISVPMALGVGYFGAEYAKGLQGAQTGLAVVSVLAMLLFGAGYLWRRRFRSPSAA